MADSTQTSNGNAEPWLSAFTAAYEIKDKPGMREAANGLLRVLESGDRVSDTTGFNGTLLTIAESLLATGDGISEGPKGPEDEILNKRAARNAVDFVISHIDPSQISPSYNRKARTVTLFRLRSFELIQHRAEKRTEPSLLDRAIAAFIRSDLYIASTIEKPISDVTWPTLGILRALYVRGFQDGIPAVEQTIDHLDWLFQRIREKNGPKEVVSTVSTHIFNSSSDFPDRIRDKYAPLWGDCLFEWGTSGGSPEVTEVLGKISYYHPSKFPSISATSRNTIDRLVDHLIHTSVDPESIRTYLSSIRGLEFRKNPEQDPFVGPQFKKLADIATNRCRAAVEYETSARPNFDKVTANGWHAHA